MPDPNLTALQTLLQDLLYNITQQNDAVPALYQSTTPEQVQISQYDENGNLMSVSVPNLAQIYAKFIDTATNQFYPSLLPNSVLQIYFTTSGNLTSLTNIQPGNCAYTTDTNTLYVLLNTDPTNINNWMPFENVITAISQHNESTSAHPYIQGVISNLQNNIIPQLIQSALTSGSNSIFSQLQTQINTLQNTVLPNDIDNAITTHNNDELAHPFLQNEINDLNNNLTQTVESIINPSLSNYMPLTGGEPPVNNTYNIGSSNFVYANMFATMFHGTATTAEYADLAEKYSIKNYESINYGIAVSISEDEKYDIEISNKNNSDKCIGIVSKNPGFMMNTNLVNAVYVALKGRVFAYVQGPVKKSDLLIAGDNGYLYKKINYKQQKIAIANQKIDSNTVELIEVIL